MQKKNSNYRATGIALGTATGAIIGYLTQNTGMFIAIGIAIGAAVGYFLDTRIKRNL